MIEKNNILHIIKTSIYDKFSMDINEFKYEGESQEYEACQFKINGLGIICRTAKTTPKKQGLFVTFWKRDSSGITTPFDESDSFDFYVININQDNRLGQFVFPKSILLQNRIISSGSKDGKRGFRVYPPWVSVKSKQAAKTQKWQVDFFYEICDETDFKKVENLYNIKKG